MSDCISRDAALESFGDAPMWTGYHEPYSFEVHMALTSIAKVIRETITQVPAADVAPIEALERLRDEMCAQDLITMEGLRKLNTLIWKYTTAHDGGVE